MSEAPSQSVSEPGQWMSVGEAAAACAVSERTLWRWIRDGVVESRQEKRGQQSTRLVNPESLPDAVSQSVSEPVSAPGTGCPDTAGHDAVGQGLNGPGQEVSLHAARAELLEREVLFLRDQLEARTTAEAELRRLLLVTQQMANMLAAQLEQKALPAPDLVTPRRVRWWWPWRR